MNGYDQRLKTRAVSHQGSAVALPEPPPSLPPCVTQPLPPSSPRKRRRRRRRRRSRTSWTYMRGGAWNPGARRRRRRRAPRHCTLRAPRAPPRPPSPRLTAAQKVRSITLCRPSLACNTLPCNLSLAGRLACACAVPSSLALALVQLFHNRSASVHPSPFGSKNVSACSHCQKLNPRCQDFFRGGQCQA